MKFMHELRLVQEHNDAMVRLEPLSVFQAEAHHLGARLDSEASSLSLA